MSTKLATGIGKLRPMFLIKPGTMSEADIRRAEELAGIIIVECTEPESVRAVELPLTADVNIQARASLEVMRIIMEQPDATLNRGSITRWFVDVLLGPRPKSITKVNK